MIHLLIILAFFTKHSEHDGGYSIDSIPGETGEPFPARRLPTNSTPTINSTAENIPERFFSSTENFVQTAELRLQTARTRSEKKNLN
jgi:hypothetical protein